MSDKTATQKEKILDFLSESNAIEGVYDTRSLLDAKKAWDYLIKQDVLTTSVVLMTHKILMSHQGTLQTHERGHYRQCPVYIGGRAALPHFLVPMEMQQWIFETMRAHPPVDAKEMHVRYERIHPFVDGNGRTGRMFMNWTRLKRTGEPLLVIKESERGKYYDWFH